MTEQPSVKDLREYAGAVAANEYENAKDVYKADLLAWTGWMRGLPDDEFMDETVSAIYNSALVNSFRGNWDHEHFKASACAHEARRRHRAAGHAEDCVGDNLYGRAHRRVMREHNYTPSEPTPCSCGLVPASPSSTPGEAERDA